MVRFQGLCGVPGHLVQWSHGRLFDLIDITEEPKLRLRLVLKAVGLW